MKSTIHHLRQKIDATAKILSETNWPTPQSREAEQSLWFAKGWLGKCLGIIGAMNPYTIAQRPEDIPDTADTMDVPDVIFNSELECMNYIRQDIKESILPEWDKLRDAYLYLLTNGDWHEDCDPMKLEAALMFAWKKLHEASMHLGFRIQNIKAENEKGIKVMQIGLRDNAQGAIKSGREYAPSNKSVIKPKSKTIDNRPK